jgi:hypothetical protein
LLHAPGDEEGGDFFYDEDEVAAGAEGARGAALDRFDAMLQIDPSRFADEDEDEEYDEEEEEEEAADAAPRA